MARYTFTASGGPQQVHAERELDGVEPPYALPVLLRLRAAASEVLREDPRFSTATLVEVRAAGESGAPITSVDRAYLTNSPPARSPQRRTVAASPLGGGA
jgi:hypothetical protein